MNWAEFRTKHLLENGPSTREELSSDYAKYKKTLPKPSPTRRTSPRTSPTKIRPSTLNNTMFDNARSTNSRNTLPARNTLSPSRNTLPARTISSPSRNAINPITSSRNTLPARNTLSPSSNTLSRNTVPISARNTLTNNVQRNTLSRVNTTVPVKSPTKQSSNIAPASVRGNKLYTMKDFDQMANNKEFLIIVLYADWCGHCQQMKTKLGKKMKDTDKIKFYNEKTLDDSVKDRYPQVLYYENGDRRKDLPITAVFDYLA